MNYQLQLDGKERTIRFNMRTLHHIKHITKTDPFQWGHIGSEPWIVSDMAKIIVLAGLRASYDFQKRDYDFTEKEVESWVGELSGKEAAQLLKAYGEAYRDDEPQNGQLKEPGEAKPMWK
jgi:hypothetical protein